MNPDDDHPAPPAAPLVGFLGAYVVVEVALYFAERGHPLAFSLAMVLLTALLLVLVIGAVLARETVWRRFGLAAATLPLFTFVRLALQGSIPPLAEVLLRYFILGLTLLLFQVVTNTRLRVAGLRTGDLLASLRIAIPIGATIALLGRLFLPVPSLYVGQDTALLIVVAGSVAFWDEYWFRGILQSQIAAAYRPVTGWGATVVLFVAFDVSAVDPTTLVFRAALGMLLGYFVWRRRSLQTALAVRTTFAIVLIALLLLT